MTAAALVAEATRYLEAVDLFRSLQLDVTWRSEATEVDALRAAESGIEVECPSCANPHVRINGRHVCLAVR